MRGIAVCLVLAGCTQWTMSDTVFQGAVVATTAVDWHQSVAIADDCRETNEVIGRCGDRVPVNVYFPVIIALEIAAAAALPKPWRRVFQAFVLGVEASTIYSNHREHY